MSCHIRTVAPCDPIAEHTPFMILRKALSRLPVTLAVILGPFLGVAFRLTQAQNAEVGGVSLTQTCRGLLCSLLFLSLWFSQGWRRLAHRCVRPLLLLSMYAVVTAFMRPRAYEHIVFAMKLLFSVLVFVNAMHLGAEGMVGRRWFAMCAWVVLCSMTVCIGIGLVTGATPTEYYTPYATAGLMNHVSTASFFVLSILPVFAGAASINRPIMIGVAIICMLLFFTMCRSALIAALVAGIACMWIHVARLRSWTVRWKVVMPIGLLLLSITIGLNTAAGADLVARFRDLNPYSGSGSGRYVFWRIALEHVTHRPVGAQVWGEGMGTIRDVLRERFGLAIGCHNDWLDCIAAFGVCGAIGIGWWCYELLRLAWCLRSGGEGVFRGVCASVIVLMLISVGNGGSFEPPWALTYASLGFWAGCAAAPRGSYRCADSLSI